MQISGRLSVWTRHWRFCKGFWTHCGVHTCRLLIADRSNAESQPIWSFVNIRHCLLQQALYMWTQKTSRARYRPLTVHCCCFYDPHPICSVFIVQICFPLIHSHSNHCNPFAVSPILMQLPDLERTLAAIASMSLVPSSVMVRPLCCWRCWHYPPHSQP